MDGEEKYLFPSIKNLLNAKTAGEKLPKPRFGYLDTPIGHHIEEHDSAWEHIIDIHNLTDGYRVKDGTLAKIKNFYAELNEFENDLKQHIHLENDILFDKSIALEKEVVK